MLAVSCPGSGAGTLRARMHLTMAVSRPGSGAGTLRARMHLKFAVSRPGNGAGYPASSQAPYGCSELTRQRRG